MPNLKKSKPRVPPIIWIAAVSAIFAGLIPSVVIAGRENNGFIMSIAIPVMIVLLIVDGIAIALMFNTKAR